MSYPQFDVVFNWQPKPVVMDRVPMFDLQNPPKDAADRIYYRPFAPFEDETGTILRDSSEEVRQAIIAARSVKLLKISVAPAIWFCEKAGDGNLGRVLVVADWSVNVIETGLVPVSLMDSDWSKRGLPWNLRPSAQLTPAFNAQKATAPVVSYDPVTKKVTG